MEWLRRVVVEVGREDGLSIHGRVGALGLWGSGALGWGSGDQARVTMVLKACASAGGSYGWSLGAAEADRRLHGGGAGLQVTHERPSRNGSGVGFSMRRDPRPWLQQRLLL